MNKRINSDGIKYTKEANILNKVKVNDAAKTPAKNESEE